MRIRLPLANGVTYYELNPAGPLQCPVGPPFKTRIAYAAAHVVADPASQYGIDFDATLAFRRHLWSLGFGLAEAMDTAQRGMGLAWSAAKELIRFSCEEAKSVNGAIACGANTDQIAPNAVCSLEQIGIAYEEQCEWIERCGGRVILMASRSMATAAKRADDYRQTYGRVLSQLSQPAIIHWLGEAFDPELKGYWGGRDVKEGMDVLLDIIREHKSKVDGVKISLLDKDREVEMRRQLPPGVRMYTGDDFNYPELIAGDEFGHSDALLGIFDGIAPGAALALRALDAGDQKTYGDLLEPTIPLSRHIFSAPTYHYKTGLTFLAYLNGFQDHFRMLGGFENARSVTHLADLFVLADRARLLMNPDLAVERMNSYMAAREKSHV